MMRPAGESLRSSDFGIRVSAFGFDSGIRVSGIRVSRPSEIEVLTRESAMGVFRINNFELHNRLFVGTGKYADYELMRRALDASGCQVVTVAVRRERLVDQQGRSLLEFLDLDKYLILPNTAGCFSADDAIRVSLLGRELLEKQGNKGAGWVKLEVLGDKK